MILTQSTDNTAAEADTQNTGLHTATSTYSKSKVTESGVIALLVAQQSLQHLDQGHIMCTNVHTCRSEKAGPPNVDCQKGKKERKK